MSNIAYKYRLYPNKEQQIWLSKCFGCCRFIWNLMLSDKQKHYEATGEALYVTPAQYKSKFPFLKEVDSLALANVYMNLNKAYKSFFSNPKKFGFPKYKSRKRSKCSYTTFNQHGTVAVGDAFIKLPKIGKIKAVIHRNAPDDYILKSATVSMHRDGTYYCSVLYEYEQNKPINVIDATSAVGLDYKSDGLYISSDGEYADMPHFYRDSQNRLARLQKKLSRKVGSRKGEQESNNHKKQAKRVAKLSHHIANQRKDYLHKKSTAITKQYDIICVEDLNMKAISNRKIHNGKATMDNGYGMFINMLSYKQERLGHALVKVDKFYPSTQLCSCCGYQNAKLKGVENLKIRSWTCPVCNTHHDRDINASCNIKNEGLRIYLEEPIAA